MAAHSTPKIILVTGSSRGIGFAAAQLLASRGVTVIVSSRDENRAKAAASKIGCDWLPLDITDQAGVEAAVKTIQQRWGRLDVLINNSAILLDHYESLFELKPETLAETFQTNVVGTFRITKVCLPLLKKSTDPRIVNVSSGAGQLEGEPQAWAPAYSISKTALNMLTQQLVAAAPEVMVNSMCPGWCRTEMGGSAAPRSAEEGADTLVWLALEAPRSMQGKFIKDRAVNPW